MWSLGLFSLLTDVDWVSWILSIQEFVSTIDNFNKNYFDGYNKICFKYISYSLTVLRSSQSCKDNVTVYEQLLIWFRPGIQNNV